MTVTVYNPEGTRNHEGECSLEGVMARHLLIDGRFWPIFWTQFFGAFNDNVLRNALVILIVTKSLSLGGIAGSEMIALCGAVFIFPFFLFSATAGQFADRISKSRLVFSVKLWELCVILFASYGFLIENLPLLLGALFMTGLQSTFFGPVKYSILPHLLREDELVSGTAYVEMGTFLSILLGTILGGALVGIPLWGAWLIGAVMVALASLGCLASAGIQYVPPVAPQLRIRMNPLPPTREILKLTFRNRSIALAILGISWFWFLGAAVLALLPPYCTYFLKAEESVITFFLAIFSIGVGVGSLLCRRLSSQTLDLGLVPLGAFSMSFFAFELFLAGNPISSELGGEGLVTLSQFLSMPGGLRIGLDLFLFCVAGGLYIVPLYTFLQQKADPAERSRVIAGNNILNSLFMVFAAVLLIVLYELQFSIPWIFLTLSLLNLIVAIYQYSIIPEFLLRIICWMIANIMYRMKVVGRENIPACGPALLVSNHVSFVDWLVISSACPRPIRFVMHYKFFQIPLAGRIFKDAKVIPIAGVREDPGILDTAFQTIAEELGRGQLVCFFPEGRLTRDGNKRKFRPGIEWIVRATPVPVVPVALNGLWGSFFSRKYGKPMSKPFRRFWSRISVVFGAPLPPQEVTSAQLFEQVSQLQRQ